MLWSLAMVGVGLNLFWFRPLGYLNEPWLDARSIHRIVGEPATVSGPLVAPATIKVATWNIQHGAKFEDVRRMLESLQADVYLLQEVDRNCRRTGRLDVAKALAEALDLNWVSAGEFQEIGEGRRGAAATTGQAILSRFPIESATAIPFEAQARFRWRLNPIQPRRGGRLVLRAHIAGVSFYNAHLESGGNERLRLRQLDEVLEDVRHERAPRVVIAGDLNNGPVTRSLVLDRLHASAFTDALGDAERLHTSHRYDRSVDWIFVKGVRASVGEVTDTEKASDHYPVLAIISTDSE